MEQVLLVFGILVGLIIAFELGVLARLIYNTINEFKWCQLVTNRDLLSLLILIFNYLSNLCIKSENKQFNTEVKNQLDYWVNKLDKDYNIKFKSVEYENRG